MFDENGWDGKTELITTHRSDEMAIIKEIAAVRGKLAGEKYTYRVHGCRPMWTTEASKIWVEESERICSEHNIQNNLIFHWFVDKARKYRQAKLEIEALQAV